MKKLTLTLLCFALAPLASADELKSKGYIKSDPLRGGNNYLIYNENGKATERIAPDPLRPSRSNHYRIYDKNGIQTGQIRPDYIDNRRYIIETVKGGLIKFAYMIFVPHKFQDNDAIAKQNELIKKKSTEIVKTILVLINSILASDDDVLISGFGKFCVKEKRERRGRNPASYS